MISLIIPAYNEENRILPVIEGFWNYFDKNMKEFEILIVANGCVDDTVKVVKENFSGYKNIRLVISVKKLGKGGAVLEGFKRAKGELVGFSDADKSVSPEDFDRLFSCLREKDCAVGSRKIKGSNITIKQSFARRFSSRAFNMIIRILFGLNIKDTQCGAKVFRKEVIDRVAPQMKSTGYEFDVELLWRTKKNGFGIAEVPITWGHSEESKFSLAYAPQMLFSLLKLRFS